MKRIVMISLMLVLVVALIAAPVMAGKPSDCTRIQDGVLTYSAGHYLEGEPLTIGYDIFGYNYQAHLFNGSYANAYLGRYGYPPYEGDTDAYYEWLVEEGKAATVEEAEALMNGVYGWLYRDVQLMMKWNDAWLSNKDCDPDGALDRHYGFPGYIGSGAWLTNHQWGYNEDGTKWTYFVKIVAAPADATADGGMWYTADGTEIGPAIWGEFAIIQQVINDKVTDDHGLYYRSPASAGFGFYQP
jgi:hypothetical protein